jgi:hypothetical protein
MYRTYAYIDGCTLTRRLIKDGAVGERCRPFRAAPTTGHNRATGSRTHLLDLVSLVTSLIPFDHNLLAVRYYANLVSTFHLYSSATSPSVESPLRRHTYFSTQASAIVQVPCPTPADPDEYEGERDVPLMVHMLRDAARDAYDVAIVITDDVALAEPIEIVTRRLRKRVGLLWPSTSNSRQLARVSSFTRYLSDAHLVAAQRV